MGGCGKKCLGTVAGAHQYKSELFVHKVVRKQEAQQHWNGRKCGRSVKRQVLRVVSGAAPESNCRAALHAPQKSADKAEDVVQGQHAEKSVFL